ncbi:flagellar protein [Cohnella sp. 56]|uniref:flagellar protein n=1 Tax=Cohnella sp. 56 TaxID=3113722 RepID=UPI0030E82D43
MALANCPRCGKLFNRHIRTICDTCHAGIEQDYEKCFKFLKDHKGVTINELSEATGVTVQQITKFIQEGRISKAVAPNLTYPCEMCGAAIRDGKVCFNCQNKLKKGIAGPAAGRQQSDIRNGFRILDRDDR